LRTVCCCRSGSWGWVPEGPAPQISADNVIGTSLAEQQDVGAVNQLAVDPHVYWTRVGHNGSISNDVLFCWRSLGDSTCFRREKADLLLTGGLRKHQSQLSSRPEIRRTIGGTFPQTMARRSKAEPR
jgi:hypothetical protein